MLVKPVTIPSTMISAFCARLSKGVKLVGATEA